MDITTACDAAIARTPVHFMVMGTHYIGMAMGYNAAYDTVHVGFVDEAGKYSGEKTTVSRNSVWLADDCPVELGAIPQ